MDRDPDECPISKEQARVVWEQVGRSLRYLGKLSTRMERIGFSPVDPLYLACCKAFDAVHGLNGASNLSIATASRAWWPPTSRIW